MNVTDAYQHILTAAEDHAKATGFRDAQLMSALRIFRRRAFRMKARLSDLRARRAGLPRRPRCLE